MPYKWIREDLNNNVYKYYFTTLSSNQRLTWKEVLELLTDKDQNFFPVFQLALVDANNKAFPYRWNCSPASQNTLDKSFEFVVKKESSLEGISPDHSSYRTPINSSSDPYFVTFLSNSQNPLIIPMPASGLDFADVSRFTKNAPFEQQKNFWQGVAKKLTEELKDGKTKWLNTHGVGVSWLHVRIDMLPTYVFFIDYQSPHYTPVSTRQTPKEKLLANLDKICLAPDGFLANNEYLKTDEAEEEYQRLFRSNKDQWKNRYLKTVIEGQEINLEDFFYSNNANDYLEVKKELIKKIKAEIKQNPSEWKIERGKNENPSDDNLNQLIRHQKTGQKHYKFGFVNFWGAQQTKEKNSWAEIESILKNSLNKEQELKKWYNPLDYPLSWALIIISLGFFIFITTVFWKRKKTKEHF